METEIIHKEPHNQQFSSYILKSFVSFVSFVVFSVESIMSNHLFGGLPCKTK